MPQAALNEILKTAGRPLQAADRVEIAGADPVLRTSFRVGTAGAAALAAVGLAVSDIWQLRTGRPQAVQVDLRHAAASLRSSRYLRLDGGPVKGHWDPFMGYYPTRDGRWVYLHCNFPHHRDGHLRLLGVPPDRDAVAAATRRWEAQAHEDAVAEAGLPGGMVRTLDEWQAHPHAAAVNALPLFEIIKLGDSPPEPFKAGERPLSGVRVLDLTRVLAGPTCARTLAEHGADVLKVNGPHLPDNGSLEMDTGIGKLATFIDLREAEDVETLKGLVRTADVFSQSYRPGTLAGRGFSPEALAALRPGIVYVTLSAFSHAGPWSARRGFDTVVQTVSGIADAQGGTEPSVMPCSAIDYVSGYLMAFGALVALARRAREGGSYLVRVSLVQTGHWIINRGRLDAAALAGLADDLPDADLARLTAETGTPFGRLRHLRPVVALSETKPFWARPPVPLGTHPPAWPN